MQIKQGERLYLRTCIIGAGIGVFMTAILTCGISAVIANGIMNEDAIDYIAVVVRCISALAGITAVSRAVKGKRLIHFLITGGLYWGYLMVITALLFDGHYQGVILSLVIIIGLSAVLGFFATGRSSGNKKSRKFHNYLHCAQLSQIGK